MISRLSAASGHPTPAEAIGCRTEVQREADMDAGISIISRTLFTESIACIEALIESSK